MSKIVVKTLFGTSFTTTPDGKGANQAVILSEGKDTADAAHFGCTASALAVMCPEAQSSIPTRTEIDAFLA